MRNETNNAYICSENLSDMQVPLTELQRYPMGVCQNEKYFSENRIFESSLGLLYE